MLVVQSALRNLADIRCFVVRHALEAGVPRKIVEAFKLAVDEACTNIIKHAYDGESGRQLDIRLEVKCDRVVVRICDDGKAFDQDMYTAPDVRARTKQRQSGGLGVYIMRTCMDEVEYRSSGGKNEICLIKHSS